MASSVVGFLLGYIGLANRLAAAAKYPEYTDWAAVYNPLWMIPGLLFLLYITSVLREKLDNKFGKDNTISEAFSYFFVSIFFGGMFYAIFILDTS